MHFNQPHRINRITSTVLSAIRSIKKNFPFASVRISVFRFVFFLLLNFITIKMCKFNQFLVLFVCCAQLIQIGVTSPLGTLLFDDYVDEETGGDYDLHYDQRQNGTENYRLNIDGVVIAVPGASSNAMNSIGLLASNYLLELAEAAAANEESNGDGVDEVESDDPPYDFEIPSGSQENDDKNETAHPVVVISADSIIKPSKPDETEPVAQDLKPENNVDAVNKKESTTNKKDLNVEIVKATEPLVPVISKPVEEVDKKDTAPASAARRKIALKRRNR